MNNSTLLKRDFARPTKPPARCGRTLTIYLTPSPLTGGHVAEGCSHLQWLGGDTLASTGGRCRRRWFGCRCGKGNECARPPSRRSSCEWGTQSRLRLQIE